MEKAWAYKDHGKSWDAVYERDHPPGFRWLHESFGTNWRLTEMQSAIGRVQLRKLDDWVTKRRANAARLLKCCNALPCLRTPEPPQDFFHAYYKFFTFLRPDRLKPEWTRDRIMQAINERGVPCYAGFCPDISQEKAFTTKNLGPAKHLPVAHELGRTSLMLLTHPTLSGSEIDRTCEVVTQICREAQS